MEPCPQLPATGADLLGFLGVGVTAVLLGMALIGVARRRAVDMPSLIVLLLAGSIALGTLVVPAANAGVEDCPTTTTIAADPIEGTTTTLAGTTTTTEAPDFGECAAVSATNCVILSESAAAGTYFAEGAGFGPSAALVSGSIVVVDTGGANPSQGCAPLVGFPAGSIALADAGGCAYVDIVANAQAAGAVGVIVVHDVAGAPIVMGGSDPTIVIPAVMVSQADGAVIKVGLPAVGTLQRG